MDNMNRGSFPKVTNNYTFQHINNPPQSPKPLPMPPPVHGFHKSIVPESRPVRLPEFKPGSMIDPFQDRLDKQAWRDGLAQSAGHDAIYNQHMRDQEAYRNSMKRPLNGLDQMMRDTNAQIKDFQRMSTFLVKETSKAYEREGEQFKLKADSEAKPLIRNGKVLCCKCHDVYIPMGEGICDTCYEKVHGEKR